MGMILCLLCLVGGPAAPAGSAESSGSPIQFLVGEWAGESEGQPGKGTVWEAPKALEPLRFLLGEWQGEGGAKPGEASGGFTFAPGLQGRVILRTNVADYPATGDKPAYRHDDLMVLYATESGELRADYYDSEGHVIRYSGSTASGNQLILVSDVVSGAPRFRLTYELGKDGALAGRFDVAPPGRPDAFGPYLAWTARRRAAGKR